MVTLFHGDDFLSSRTDYAELKDKNSLSFNALEINLSDFKTYVSAKGFFPKESKIFIENLFSKKALKNFDEIVDLINKTSEETDYFLWEDSLISEKSYSKINNVKTKSYSLPKMLFTFLDNIRPGNSESIKSYHLLLEESDEYFLLTMIIRQFRLLMTQSFKITLIEESKRLAPWQTSKLSRQLSHFSKDQLASAYQKLYEIDKKHKTGVVDFPLSKSIDFFLAGL